MVRLCLPLVKTETIARTVVRLLAKVVARARVPVVVRAVRLVKPVTTVARLLAPQVVR